MSRESLHAALRDMGWSLFTELGVPGVIRHHQRVAIDPEPILVSMPLIFDLDPRLRDQVYGWCRAHADRISVSRLQGLSRALPSEAREAFGAFAATLRADADVRWPTDGAGAWPRAPEVEAPRLPLERAALLRLRIRALSGVGARADVLAELIARSGSWTRASDLAPEGYSKRTVAGILSELSDAELARCVPERNALTYQLSRPETLRELVRAHDLAFPSWRRVMSAVLAFLDLSRLEAKAAGVRRVEANKRREELRRLSDELWLDTPPVTRGNPEAWEDLMAWCTENAVALANGTSAALDVQNVRAAAVEGGGEAWVWLHRTAPDHERLSGTLGAPQRSVDGVSCSAVSPASGGWTAFQLRIAPPLDEVGIRNKVEHLVAPMKVAWRQVTPG